MNRAVRPRVRRAVTPLAPLLLWLAFTVPAVAQHQPGDAHADCCGLPWWAKQQAVDGHWSAVRGGGRAEADLRVSALMLLVGLGDGSTMRQGPIREPVRGAVRWLRAQLDARGRFALRADPDWPLDQAIATFALTEAMLTSRYLMLAPDVRSAAVALRQQLETMRPVPDVELRLWGELVASSLLEGEKWLLEVVSADEPAAQNLGADDLARTLAQLPAVTAVTPRQRAAQFLRGARSEADVVVAAPPIAWVEAPLQDPLASFYAFAGLYQRGGEPFNQASRRLTATLVSTEVKEGEARGSWDPAGGFGAQNGRLGSTAVALLMLQIYYRYSRLGLFR